MKNLKFLFAALIGLIGLLSLNSCEKEELIPSLETTTLSTETENADISFDLENGEDVVLELKKNGKSSDLASAREKDFNDPSYPHSYREKIYSNTFSVDYDHWVNLRLNKHHILPQYRYTAVVTPLHGEHDLYVFGYDDYRHERWRLIRKSLNYGPDESYLVYDDLQHNETEAYFSVYGKNHGYNSFKIEVFKEKICHYYDYKYLVFYDKHQGKGQGWEMHADGAYGRQTYEGYDWNKNWHTIQPYKVGDKTYCLFYDQSAGHSQIYDIDYNGSYGNVISEHHDWRKTWHIIKIFKVCYQTYAFFYDKHRGQVHIYEILENGHIGRLVYHNNHFDPYYDIITPYHVEDNTFFLFYDNHRGLGKIYEVAPDGQLGRVTYHDQHWRRDWKIIKPYYAYGKTYLFLYAPSSRHARIVKAFGNGTLGNASPIHQPAYSNHTYDVITPYWLDGRSYLLSYSKQDRLSNTYEIDEQGQLGRQTHHNQRWENTWDYIVAY